MSLDATFYGFATLADAKAAWHQQLARILSSMLDRGVIIDALLASPPATQQIVATDGAAPAILWALWRALEGGSIATSYWQTTTGESYLLEPAATDDFCQQLTLGITKYIGLCKANARTIGDAIDAAGTIDAVLVIDMGAGWPSNALASGISWDEYPSFLDLSDTPNSYSGAATQIVRVNAAETALEFVDHTFLALEDTPDSYSGAANQMVVVNDAGDGLTFVDAGLGNGSGTGAQLRNRDFDLNTRITYFDVAPTALLDFTEPFTSDTGQFTHFTESTQATFAAAGTGTVTNTSGAARNNIVVEGSDLTMPLVGVTIDVVSRTGTLSSYSNFGVGIAKDANNFVWATVDSVANTVRIQLKISGTNTFNASVSRTLTPPYTLGFSLVGNSACAYVKISGVWQFLTGYAIPTATINFKSASLTGWKRGFVVATPNNHTWEFDNFYGGAFGGSAIRDMAVICDADGSPYIYNSGGADYLDITATLPDGLGISACGILKLNITAYAITQIGCIMIDRGGSKHNDHAGQIIRDSSGSPTYRLWISSWGNGFGGDISIYYYSTTTDIRSGSHLLSGATLLTIPLQASGYAAYDPFVVKDGSTWRMAHSICENTTFSGSPFYPAVATSTDLSTWTDGGSDPTARPYEGPRFVKLGDELAITASTAHVSRIYDKHMNFRGILNATLNGGSLTYPHANVVDVGTKLLLITFNNAKANGATASFTWGQLEIHEAQ